MAEYIMKKLVKDAGMQDVFEIASAATSTEELGNPVYPPAKQKLAEHGIACNGHRARQVTIQDYHYYDIIVAMDSHNIRNMTCTRCLVATPSTKSTCCSTTPKSAGMWQTLGTPTISMLLGVTA